MRSPGRHVIRNACLAVALVLWHRGDASGLCQQTSVKETLAASEAVIQARVLEIQPSDPAGWRALRLDTARVWKPGKSVQDVLAFDSDERPPFEVGKTYLMFIGKRPDGRLAIGRCSPLTREVSQAGREIEELFRLASEDRVAYRAVPGLCLPCDGRLRSHILIASRGELDRITADIAAKCGNEGAAASAAEWRERVERSGIDFSREVLLILYEVIGTGGTSALDVQGPSDGVLKVAVRWTTPKGPALPIATAACHSIAVDRSRVRRIETPVAGALDVPRP